MIRATRYPLSWPLSVPRTPAAKRVGARFSQGSFGSHRKRVSLARARDGLIAELERLDTGEVILSTNVELRLDGLPYANRRAPEDPGTALYFRRRGQREEIPYAMACDRYDRVADNVRALAVTIESMRRIERHGSTELFDQAFSGFAALPPPKAESCWSVLGLAFGASLEQAEAAYRRIVAEHHPDLGGSPDRMIEANAAIAEIREQAGAR